MTMMVMMLKVQMVVMMFVIDMTAMVIVMMMVIATMRWNSCDTGGHDDDDKNSKQAPFITVRLSWEFIKGDCDLV